MGYRFTEEQKARIQTAIDEAEAGGSWSEGYELVASIVAAEPDASGAMPILSDQQVQASRLWLLGAAQANAGEGAFSALIRDYTARQYELHFGVSLSDGLGQAASDAVASEVLNSIANGEALPTIGEIAENDATAVGQTLFATRPNGGDNKADTAGDPEVNAAWSGSVLFSFFDNGQLDADETGRLLTTGASDARLDSINDLRDVVFAYDAFTRSASVANLAGPSLANQFTEPGQLQQIDEIITGVRDPSDFEVQEAMSRLGGLDEISALEFLDSGALLGAATEGQAAGNAFAWVDQLGAERLLGAVESVLGEGDDSGARFVDRAHALFSGLKDSGELGLRLQRVDRIAVAGEPVPGQPLPTEALVNAARSDSPEGKAVLFALHQGNPLVVLGRDAGETAALYQRFDGDGFVDADNFSEQYLQDRAAYLSQLHVETEADGSQDGVNDVRLRDLASDTVIGSPSPLSPVWAFGSAEGESITGSTIAESPDRLYGGRGDDTLRGLAGDDRLEGQGGDDDLFGGTGDDVLRGGRGDDDLAGGAGDDTYRFQPGSGSDIVTDSDGQGRILVDDEVLGGSDNSAEVTERGPQWTGPEGTEYTLVAGNLDDGIVEISGGVVGDDGRIVVEDFANGDLGVELDASRELAFSFDNTTPFGGGSSADPSLALAERGARTFQVFTDLPGTAGDTITLSLSGGPAGQFEWRIGDERTVAGDQAVTLDVGEDSDRVAVTLVHTGDLDADTGIAVEARYTDAGGTERAQGTLDVTVAGSEEPSDGAIANVIRGDRVWLNNGSATEPEYEFDALGNRVTTGDAVLHEGPAAPLMMAARIGANGLRATGLQEWRG